MPDLFTKRLSELLGRHHMTFADLARRLEVAKSTAIEWREKVPRADHLVAIADCFGVSVDWLVGRPHAAPWSPQVRHLCDQLRSELTATTLPSANLEQRLAHAMQTCRLLFGREQSDFLVASVLGVTEAEVEPLYTAGAPWSDGMLLRFAEFTGIPVQWFLQGETRELCAVEAGEYLPAMMTLRAMGVSVSEFMRHFPVLVHVVEHVRRIGNT